jgi:hypothetical protein
MTLIIEFLQLGIRCDTARRRMPMNGADRRRRIANGNNISQSIEVSYPRLCRLSKLIEPLFTEPQSSMVLRVFRMDI